MATIFESPIVEWITDLTLGNEWQVGVPLPVPLFESGAAVVDNRLYVFGGFTTGLRATDTVYSYSIEQNQWQAVSKMPLPITHMNATVDGQYVWFVGGFVGDHPGYATNSVWRFDTETCTWNTTFPLLPANRAGGSLQVYNGTLHYFGGFDGDRHPRDLTYADHWAMSLSEGETWEKRAPLPETKGHQSTVVLRDCIYAIGGQIRHDTNPQDLASVYAYDPMLDRWEERAPLPEPRSHFESSTFVYRDKILVIGGRNNQERRLIQRPLFKLNEKPIYDSIIYQLYLRATFKSGRTSFRPTVTLYDPHADTWEELASLPMYLLSPIANVLDETLVVAGGGRRSVWIPQCRTLLNETLVEAIKASETRLSNVVETALK